MEQLPVKYAKLKTSTIDQLSKVRKEQTRAMTPMPTEVCLSPAWNPVDIEASPSSSSTIPSPPIGRPPPVRSHVLLTPALAGAVVNVSIKNSQGEDKPGVVNIQYVNGAGSIRRTRYNTSERVPEESVTPKHPSATHDNGLVVVIKGEHCGKYGRRLHHRHQPGQDSIMILGVVEINKNAKDTVTGESIEVETGSLCTAFETKEKKTMNQVVMKEARVKYRGL